MAPLGHTHTHQWDSPTPMGLPHTPGLSSDVKNGLPFLLRYVRQFMVESSSQALDHVVNGSRSVMLAPAEFAK